MYLNRSTTLNSNLSYHINPTMDMDWYSWLSKTAMEPTLVYEYGLIFSRNELEEGDIAHFSHEFLQSMGISIAKHRLEILKLGRKVGTPSRARPVSKIIVAIKRTKRCLAKYIPTWGRSEDSALALVPIHDHNSRRKCEMAKRSKSVVMSRQGRLMPRNGKVTSFSGPIVHEHCKDIVNVDDGYYSMSSEEIKWGSMFHNLKPT